MKWTRCRRRRDISLLAAGVLSTEEKHAVECHLAVCQECQDYYGGIKTLTAPLEGWEKELSAVEATPAAQRRWAKAVRESGGQPALKHFWRIVWGELIRPSRYAWAGMAALWVAMLAINGQLSDHRNNAGVRAASSQEMIQAWEEQKRVLAELTRPAFLAPVQPPNLPRPRSQREQNRAII